MGHLYPYSHSLFLTSRATQHFLATHNTISPKHQLRLRSILTHSFKAGHLIPSHFSYHIPVPWAAKLDGSYSLVQGLCLTNTAVLPIHPVVPNPYTILSHTPSPFTHFSVLDIKDASFFILFCLPWSLCLHLGGPHHSNYLTFHLECPPTEVRGSPHLFGQALVTELLTSNLLHTTPLQCAQPPSLSPAYNILLLLYTCPGLEAIGSPPQGSAFPESCHLPWLLS